MGNGMVDFKSNEGSASGYLALPKSGKGAGVIVIQEWWGLVPHIKDICDRFASKGFLALAPDLFHGKSTVSPDEAGRMMMALQIDQAENDLKGAVQFLLNHEAASNDKVGCVGFCMGGQLALYAASKKPRHRRLRRLLWHPPQCEPRSTQSPLPLSWFFRGRRYLRYPRCSPCAGTKTQGLGEKNRI